MEAPSADRDTFYRLAVYKRIGSTRAAQSIVKGRETHFNRYLKGPFKMSRKPGYSVSTVGM